MSRLGIRIVEASFNLRNGRILNLDRVSHHGLWDVGQLPDVPVVMNGEPYKTCRRHRSLVDGGLSRHSHRPLLNKGCQRGRYRHGEEDA